MRRLAVLLAMEPRGWGDVQPIDRNTTAAGRANNRRVQFQLELDDCCRPLKKQPAEPPPEQTALECR